VTPSLARGSFFVVLDTHASPSGRERDALRLVASCTTRAWFYTAPGHYTVSGSLRTHYVVGGTTTTDLDYGSLAVLPLPTLAFDAVVLDRAHRDIAVARSPPPGVRRSQHVGHAVVTHRAVA
jgi:hypothetical protein